MEHLAPSLALVGLFFSVVCPRTSCVLRDLRGPSYAYFSPIFLLFCWEIFTEFLILLVLL